MLHILSAIFTEVMPSKYYLHLGIGLASIIVVWAYAQGRSTTRDRDLHARTILVTGGFTPLGLTLLQALAQRGAHIIALSPRSLDSPDINILVDLLRTTTNNEHVYVEECDLSSPNSVRSFCNRFLTGETQRLDAIVFAHEYQHVGALFSRDKADELEKERQIASLATFLIITLLLPVLLVAPVERDIRIISVVNPFYAAAVPFSSPDQLSSPSSSSSVFVQEGRRSLRMIILIRHLQRVLDAMPSGAQVPKAKADENAVPVVSKKLQQSNIVAVSVSPGISRTDTVAPYLGADKESTYNSMGGLFIYVVLQPILRLLTKAPSSALQSVLHVLFLPTPFKVGVSEVAAKKSVEPGEVLKPGSLYSNCAVVNLKLPVAAPSTEAKGDAKESRSNMGLPDDGELGGEEFGGLVWDQYERQLKEWDMKDPPEMTGNKDELRVNIPTN